MQSINANNKEIKRPIRKISNDRLWQKLDTGELKSVMEYASDPKNQLDIQIRDNYLNVYYKGGNILEIRQRALKFDKFYFYTDKSKRKTHLLDSAKKGDKNAKQIINDLEEERTKMLNILIQEKDAKKYFEQAKSVMDKWFDFLEKELNIHHYEKEEQQNISMNNHFGNSDYTVLDLEYEVSTLSPFKYNGPKDIVNKVRPRFDIIAIDNKTHRLVVIELKKGMGATGGVSGIMPHIVCFKHTIGRDKEGIFLKEMKDLCNQKIELGFIDRTQFISDESPEFIFAFADKPGEDKFEEFKKACQTESYSGNIIYLTKDCRLINK